MKKDEKLQLLGDSQKHITFRGGECSRKTNIEGGLPRKRVLESLSIEGGEETCQE